MGNTLFRVTYNHKTKVIHEIEKESNIQNDADDWIVSIYFIFLYKKR